MGSFDVLLGNIEKLNKRINDGLAFVLILRGNLYIEINNRPFLMEKNDIAVINHNDMYTMNNNTKNVVLLIHLSRQYMEDHCPEVMLHTYSCISSDAEEGMDPLFHSLKKNIAQIAFLYYKMEPGYELLLQAEMYKVLHFLWTNFKVTSKEDEAVVGSKNDRLHSILEYIHKNYKNRINLEEIAQKEFMSVQYVSKLFRKKMGINFLEYLNGLRIKSVVHDLLHTEEPITQIAMSNGFASVKALNTQFKKVYDVSPFEYRKQYQVKDKNIEQDMAADERVWLLKQDSQNSLEDLVKFIKTYNEMREESSEVQYFVDVTKDVEQPSVKADDMVHIGDIKLSLRSDTRKQLEIVQRQLNFKYAYCSVFGIANKEKAGVNLLLHYYDYFESINILRNLNLIPFFRVDISFFLSNIQFSDADSSYAWFDLLLNRLSTSYDKIYFQQWIFEIAGTYQELKENYVRIYTAIKKTCSSLKVGIRLELDNNDPDKKSAAGFIKKMGNKNQIDLLTFTFDPNKEAAPADAKIYENYYKNYHLIKLNEVKHLAEECGITDIPIYVTGWNTLTGKNIVEAGEFHRTALLMDTIFSLYKKVEGISVPLNLFSDPGSEQDFISYPITLFLYRDIQRPVYFVYKALNSLGTRNILRENNIVVSEEEGRYTVIIYNPCYINPFEALADIRRKTHTYTFEVNLMNIPKGKYRIKRYFLDKDNGSVYHSWVKVDFTLPLDEEDFDEYLQSSSKPEVKLSEQEIDGTFTITQQLTLNAMALYVIKKI